MHKIYIFFLCSFVLLVLLFTGTSYSADIQIPSKSDWTYKGVALTASSSGWDKRFYGQISPCTVIKKNGKFFLYYVGADGNRSTDGGPRHRALGVATSTDGINFTKYSGNPIITHLPHNNQEEGVFSAGAFVDQSGKVVLYYGAIWAANSTTETVDVYVGLAVSDNGLDFTDMGYVFRPTGQEVTPLGTIFANNSWYVYYLNTAGWNLKLLSGPSMNSLTDRGTILSKGLFTAEPVFLSTDKLALFIVDKNTNGLEVRTAPVSSPGQISSVVENYGMFPPRYRHTTVICDQESGKWYMYQCSDQASDGNQIIVRTAPVVGGSGPVRLGESYPVQDGVHPNPFSTSVNVKLSMQNENIKFQIAKLKIFNTQGKILHSAICNLQYAIYGCFHWNAQDQPTGMYLIKVKTGDKVISKRITLVK
jgi:hypothetical protein